MSEKKCIVCDRPTAFTAARTGVEAAFCHYHYPLPEMKIKITVCVQY